MQSAEIQCLVSAQEKMVSVEYLPGSFDDDSPGFVIANTKEIGDDFVSDDLPCSPLALVPANYLSRVTAISNLAFAKMQGPDGFFEPISLVPAVTPTAIKALEVTLERMVAVGATDMYDYMYEIANASIFDNSTSFWTVDSSRLMLGDPEPIKLAFLVSPAVMIILLVLGWIFVGLVDEGDITFDPLDPTCAAAAGAGMIPPPTADDLSQAAWLGKLPAILHYAPTLGKLTGMKELEEVGKHLAKLDFDDDSTGTPPNQEVPELLGTGQRPQLSRSAATDEKTLTDRQGRSSQMV